MNNELSSLLLLPPVLQMYVNEMMGRDRIACIIAMKMGRLLVWDATCIYTLVPSHLPSIAGYAGATAPSTESLKRGIYQYIMIKCLI